MRSLRVMHALLDVEYYVVKCFVCFPLLCLVTGEHTQKSHGTNKNEREKMKKKSRQNYRKRNTDERKRNVVTRNGTPTWLQTTASSHPTLFHSLRSELCSLLFFVLKVYSRRQSIAIARVCGTRKDQFVCFQRVQICSLSLCQPHFVATIWEL